MKPVDYIFTAVLALAVFFVIFILIKRRKSGKNLCSCGCAGCGGKINSCEKSMPKNQHKKILAFIKKETVFFIALTFAVVSMFFVKPSKAYLSYIDFNTLFILFSLMAVVQAFRTVGLFEKTASILCNNADSIRSLSFILVMFCFFFSMFITNDVALLTFVPLTIELLKNQGHPFILMYTVILETVAANTGSMLTPLGNPQNLFLFEKFGISFFSFSKIILPYSLLSLVLLCVSVLFIPKRFKVIKSASSTVLNAGKIKTIFFSIIFVISILSVVRIIPKWLCAVIVFAVIFILDRKILLKVDYMLLLTFTAFFIFTGNIASVGSVKDFLMNVVGGNEFFSALVSSQVISNVPATLLLYPFCAADGAVASAAGAAGFAATAAGVGGAGAVTSVTAVSPGLKNLLIGVNAGGLGTLIASLASLISYKIYSREQKKLNLPSSGKYFLLFTLINILFLAFMVGLWFLINAFL